MRSRILFASIGLLLCMTSAVANDNPSFSNGILAIPTVDSADTPGLFQEVVLEVSDQGEIELIDYKEGINLRIIDDIALIQSNTFPVQIFLKITGTLSSDCLEVGQVNHKLSDTVFEVRAYFLNNPGLTDPNILCADIAEDFSKTIALPVFGLSAGDYTYNVNGMFTGSFTLPAFNGFSD